MKNIFFILIFLSSLFLSAQEDYIRLNDFIKMHKLNVQYSTLQNSIVLLKNETTVKLFQDKPWFMLDYKTKELMKPLVYKDENYYLSRESANSILEHFTQKPSSTSKPSVDIIFLDPGHGGKDMGAINREIKDGNSFLKEKDIVLKVALKLKADLEKKYSGKEVIISRETDVFLELEDRSELANFLSQRIGNKHVLYISIHANSSVITEPKGFEVWYLSNDNERYVLDKNSSEKLESDEVKKVLNSVVQDEYLNQSKVLGEYLVSGLKKYVGKYTESRGIRRRDFYVVRNSYMPSVLVELGFVSNPKEGQLLTQNWYLNSLTDGLFAGVVHFIDKFE